MSVTLESIACKGGPPWPPLLPNGAFLTRRGGHGGPPLQVHNFRSLKAFDSLAHEPFVVFIEPPSLDTRILNQFALFSLMPDPSARLDTWLENHPQLYRRVIVPAELKWEVRDKLDQANINERTLFPGLDGLSRWLERYYTPKSRSST